MPIELPALPYPHTALEPHLSGETVEQHHGHHQRADIERVNALITGTALEDATLEDIVRRAQGRLFEHAAQAWNTDFYWRGMAPPTASGSAPRGPLASAIDASFGSLDALRQQFDTAALRGFGAGWAWLVQRRDGRLGIAATPNAVTPLTGPDRPLLACCLWQHAYYLDYRDQRERYLAAWWQLVNWGAVGSRLTGS
ncbi:superoxide dismutase [Fe] [Lysobacteraceae bacterium NML91-0213]|nr:superoxide dismutase [Fe] [Xanthomonadaceae bacterium NML91-0213]